MARAGHGISIHLPEKALHLTEHDFYRTTSFTMDMRKNYGFTLIELMMTLVIAAILLTIGMPAMNTFVKNNRLTLVTNELVSAAHVARSNAIKDDTFGCVCPSGDVTVAAPVCSGLASWETGWIAFTDPTGACADSSAGTLLKVWDGSQVDASQLAVRADHVSITTPNFIRFNSRGATQQLNGASQQGSFSICDDRGVTADAQGNALARAVQLSISGRVRSTRLASQINACPF